VTIERDQPGSYRLTSNLNTDSAVETVVRIVDSHVTVDLNGFTISGPNVCSGMPLVCTALGGGAAVDVLGTGVVVRNGIVLGMGNYGISLGSGNHVDAFLVASNGDHGIVGQHNSMITGCRVERNRFIGIAFLGGNLIRGNIVHGNGTTGIFTDGGGSLITDNTVTSNPTLGGSFATGDASARNVFGGNAIEASGGTQIEMNLCGSSACP
jgi:parallel beta-helix repeat protein